MAVVTNTSHTPDGKPAAVTVLAELVAGPPAAAGYTPGGTVIHRARAVADELGAWSLDLTPNATIRPTNTHYRLTEYTDSGTYRHTIIVPPGGPYTLLDVLAVAPPPPDPLVPIGGGGAVASVDGMVGAVDLSGRYAALAHLHDDRYSALAHEHDERYAALVHAHAAYALTGHDHDSRYAALAHLHDARYAMLDHLHDARYAALVHDHDGRYDLRYSALAHTHTGYALTGHDHDARYAMLAHDHDARYDARYATLAHTHTGYAAAGHLHDDRYSLLAHLHDERYAALVHTHAGYALAAHDHDAAALVSGTVDRARLPALTLAQRPVVGRWAVVPPVGSVAAATLTLGELLLTPFVVGSTFVADQLSAEVNPSAVGASLRLLIYGATATLQPGAQVLDLGVVDASSNGAKLWTPPGTFTFTPGVWWFGLLPIGAAPGVRGAATWHPLVHTDVVPVGTGTASGYAQAGVGTSPPANVSATLTPKVGPRVSVRAA
ncbi:hypothetical protein AB0M43_33585 [Longispora sp. NPDC051575]|uniref:hypothetical protein n=1 Tax=Longispora sp. NPDC051575 TaxID=3154943 RepID=UPI0034446610